MTADRLLDHFERIADAPDAIARLRRFILDLAVRGQLVPQDPQDEPASELLKRLKKKFSQNMQKSGRIEKNEPTIPEYSLPSNWLWARIGDHLDLINGKAFKPSEWLQVGIKIVRIQNLNRPDAHFDYCDPTIALDRYLINDGTFLISWSGTPGTSFGAFIWDRGPAILNQHIFRCEFRVLAFDTKYLRLAINGRLDEMIAKAHGGVGLQHITKGKLESLLIALPPLAEQRRIVAKVDELMALCDRLAAVRAEREKTRDRLAAASLARLDAPDPATFADDARFALTNLPALTARADQVKQLRQTILNLAVCGKLVPQDAADEPASELLKRIATEKLRLVKGGVIPRQEETVRSPARLVEGLPASWETTALGKVCGMVTSGSRGWAEFYADSGPGFLRAQNIRFGKLRLDDLAFVTPPSNAEGSRTQVAVGDLLIVITGAGVTNPALLDRDLGEAYVSQHVALVRPIDTKFSKWLLLCLMAPAGGRTELLERAYGAGKPGLNLENIRLLGIPLPPLAEQHRIVAKVDALMALCDRLEASLAAGDATRRRLLEALLAEALAPGEALAEAAA